MKRANGKPKPRIVIKNLSLWAQAEWRKLRRIMRGDAKSRSTSRLLHRLNKVLVSAAPRANRRLIGSFIGRLGSALIYAESLEKNLRELAPMNRRGRREHVRLNLSVMDEQLNGLTRQTRGLKRDISRLVKHLGTTRDRKPPT